MNGDELLRQRNLVDEPRPVGVEATHLGQVISQQLPGDDGCDRAQPFWQSFRHRDEYILPVCVAFKLLIPDSD